jgi:N-acetylneuraminic acid mutarotase
LFNPATGTWAVTGSMNAGRSSQSATLLPNGKVLVAGGLGASGSFLASAELYNPATGTWALTGSMTTPRENQSATLLNNGRVLVAGGSNNTGPLTSAELYNPATGKFTQTGSMTTPRETHDATLLPDGDVLVTAGVETSGLYSELYHPATGQWSAATGGLGACSSVRECGFGSSATLLGTGNVLVAGGFTGLNSNPSTTTSAMLYDPATNAWTTTGPMSTPRENQTANLLPDGRVLVAGGASFSNHTATFLASAELYTP